MTGAVSIAHTVSCTHPEGPALLPLRALAAVSGIDSAAVTFSPHPLAATATTGPGSFGNPSGIAFRLETATAGAFGGAGAGGKTTVSGLAAIVRFFAGAHPTLGLGGRNAAAAARVDGWVEAGAAALLAAAASGDAPSAEVAAELRRSVEEFGSSVEAALTKGGTQSKYLVGDGVTAADVIVAVLLAAAATRTQAAPLGPRTDALLHTILTNATIRAAIGDEGVSKEEMRAAEGVVPKLAAEMDKLSVGGAGGGAGGAGGSAAEGKGGPVPTAAELAANPLVLRLAELGLSARTYGHVPCMTADELVASVPLPSASHSHTKNLFFKDKKHGLYLLTTTPAAAVDTKSLGKNLLKLEGKVNLRLASEEVLMAKLGCARGCVGPLAIANNAERDVTLVLDENLLKAGGGIHSHPLRNDASTVLTSAQLGDYLAKLGVEPVVVDFPQKDGGAEDRGREAEQRAGKPPASRPKADKKAKPKIPKKEKKDGAPKAVNKDKKQVKKGETLLALQWKKEENFPMWYSDVIVLSEMISYYDISGCYILRPWSYKMWELIQVRPCCSPHAAICSDLCVGY